MQNGDDDASITRVLGGLAHSRSAVESSHFCSPLPPNRSSSCTSSPAYSAASLSAGSGCWVLPLSTAPLYSSFTGRGWSRPALTLLTPATPAHWWDGVLHSQIPTSSTPYPQGLPSSLLSSPHITFLGVRRQRTMEGMGQQVHVEGRGAMVRGQSPGPLLGPPLPPPPTIYTPVPL